ncbi:MAG: hypothetical protein AAB966_04150 [Patescibacteria group bacterium]
MKESKTHSVNQIETVLKQGSIIELADVTELSAFEDQVAQIVIPKWSPKDLDEWNGRIQLKNLIYPKIKGSHFHGIIANIQLQVLAEAYERIHDANSRGWRFNKEGSSRPRTLPIEYVEEYKPRYVGFSFIADALSSGKGQVGQIQTEIYFCPRVEYRSKSHNYKPCRSFYGPLNRVVLQPRIETERFIAFNEASRRIAFQVLREGMTHPLSTPMRD